ncbi:MAG: AAA family ATPase [Betaproteobacteria bacterium]|nr:AAA family ATPase [Betaproteobacteria bacterium]
MLLHYAISNFQSFLQRTEVNLCVNQRVTQTDWIAEQDDLRISKVMGVLGPNGAGKTALLKPIAFLGWFFSSSFLQTQPGSEIPVYPHLANPDQPIEIECTFSAVGSIWKYKLCCTPQRVLEESLYRKETSFRYVFSRKWEESKNQYTVKQQDFGLDEGKAMEARSNVSLIAWAAQYGVPLALNLAKPFIFSNIGFTGRIQANDFSMLEAATKFQHDEQLKAQMERLLCSWDLGLSGVDLREIEVAPNPLTPDIKQKFYMPYGRHSSHGKEFILPFVLESNGTKSALSLLSYLLAALAKGGLAVIDEFESDLHPHMLDAVLGLFASPNTNPNNAQLLFTSHSIEVLNTLNKAQIMLVEKDENCESQALRLDQILGVRGDISLYNKYMAGAFGAVPNL